MKSLFNALNMAISMFTIIPLPKYTWDEAAAKHMMKLYPVVGLIIGALWYSVYRFLDYFGVPIMLSSAILMAIPYILTGFLHLDGFMDVCDALLSRKPMEVKIKILKDSNVGAFAVISLVLLLITEFAAVNSLLSMKKEFIFLIIIPIISRSLVGYFLITRETIGESYFGKLFKEGTGILDKILLIGIYFISFIICYFVDNLNSLITPLAMGILAFILQKNTGKELGGFNGDVAGYILVLTEFLGIIVLSII